MTRLLPILFLTLGPAFARAAVNLPAADPAGLSESLQREARAALDRGARWLIRHQDESGAWSNREFPALTGLAIWALVGAGQPDSPAVDRGIGYIVSCIRPDGSIWVEPTAERRGGGLSNYNTALCMVALHAVNDPELNGAVRRARAYLAGTQHLGSDEFRGGMGYDPDTDRPYADLSNSYMSYEAMRLTANLKDLEADAGGADLDWEAAAAFVSSLQNTDGGFIYKPGMSQAGATTNAAGEVTLRSYGSMTYAGLLSLIYAEVDRDDPRVVSAFEWAARHWSLSENPGMGQEGLYYFFNILAKSLAAFGRETFATGAGATVHWRTDLVRRLVNLQKTDPERGDGYWVNDAGRWLESDPVLVTAYSMLALAVALGAP